MTDPQPDDEADEREPLWWLAAQTPVIPPDETRGIAVIRPFGEEERTQYVTDSKFLRDLSSFSLFRAASDATEQLQDLARRLAMGGGRFLSEREKSQVAKALAHARSVMSELPNRVIVDLAPRRPPLEGVKDELERMQISEAFRRLQTSSELPLDPLVIAVGDEVHEIVIPPAPVGHWSQATDLDRRAGVGILSLVEFAQAEINRVAARWLVAQEEEIRAASLRVSAVAAEVIEGAPCLIGAASERELTDLKGQFTFDDLPLSELRGLQEALLRGKRLFAGPEREAATKGPRGMTAEQVLAAVSDQLPPLPADAEDDQREEQTSTQDTPDVSRALMAMDPAALLAHAEQAAYVLEEAWSSALQEPARQRLIADWETLLASVEVQLVSPTDDQSEVPAALRTVAQLALQPQDEQLAEAHRAAVQLSIWQMRRPLASLKQPTMVADDPTYGRRRFFSSGAFAMLRARNRRLAELADLAPTPGPGLGHLRRAQLAAEHADAEAVLLHCTRALAAAQPDLTALDEDALAIVGLGWEAIRELADGKAPDEAVLVVLSQALLQVVSGLVGP